jgi:hypothetical protein
VDGFSLAGKSDAQSIANPPFSGAANTGHDQGKNHGLRAMLRHYMPPSHGIASATAFEAQILCKLSEGYKKLGLPFCTKIWVVLRKKGRRSWKMCLTSTKGFVDFKVGNNF